MDRRQFLKLTSTGAVALATGKARGAGSNPANEPLPSQQSPPLPSLGTHWDNVFQHVSARCKPRMSFLEDTFHDPAAWSERARAVLKADLHYAPPACDPEPQLLDRTDCGRYVREYLRIQTAPNIRVPIYMLVPKHLDGPAPAIVALHDHGGFYFWGKEKLVHIEPEHPALTAFKKGAYAGRSIADDLADRGFVVIACDMLHWGERGMYFEADPERIRKRTLDVTDKDVREFNQRSWQHEELVSRTALTCGATWSGLIASDDVRVADYLLSRPEVDRTRVGCVGLSLGSVRAIFLGALHPAIRASVAVCWMAGYQPMARQHVRWSIGYTKLVPGLYTDMDWPDLAGLHWPGALMTINGLQDKLYPLEAAQSAVEKVNGIFAKMGCPERYEGVFFDGPHEFNADMQQRAFDWLTKQLS